MEKDRLSGKLAVILHADVAGSTALVQQDKQLAHERIHDTFLRWQVAYQIVTLGLRQAIKRNQRLSNHAPLIINFKSAD